LCAALCAREAGAKVTLFESAPQHLRAGNSRHARNFRVMSEAYPENEYFADLVRVTGGRTDEELARLVIRSTPEALDWMKGYGVKVQPAFKGTLHLDRTNTFFLGGGKALINTYYAQAVRRGITVIYDAEVTGLRIQDGVFESASVVLDGKIVEVRAHTLVAASGGFEANLDWLREGWGDAASNFTVRGTPHNKGKVLRLLLDAGATQIGDPSQCHAIAVDARGPKFDGGIVTRLDTLPLGIVVNRDAQRFYDEGEDLWPKRYAIWGRLIAQQPDQLAYSIIDAKLAGKFVPSAFPALRGSTIAELAGALGLPAQALKQTIADYNASIRGGTFDISKLDDCRTDGLTPDKTHWAQPIDTPPFLGYPLRPGITFTYMGVRVNQNAAVIMQDGKEAKNIFAAGEIMAGNILGQGYLAGIGITIGTVFGRIAGREAGRLVL
jgi:tricarballylate dehydrogenase